MAITPQTDLYLIKSPLESDNLNQLTFSNKTAQVNYFSNLPHLLVQNFTYQRRDNVIRYPGHIDSIQNYNYVMYRNNNYTNKYFYAFITRMEYINDNMTHIYIKTDVYQSWLFDLDFKNSFIEREHVNNDTVGKHTVPENLELGEYISNQVYADESLKNYQYLIQVTEWISTEASKPLSTNLGGVPVPGGVYVCDTVTAVDNIIQAYQTGRENAITNVYMIPSKIVDHTGTTSQYDGKTVPTTYNLDLNKQTTIDGYTPKNKKLLTYPYNMLVMANNSGSSNILQYEMFSDNKCTFTVEGVPTVGGSIKCIPTNYKGHQKNEEEGIMCGKFPTCGWVNDTYTNWLTQNAVNIGIGVATSGLSIVGGVVSMATGVGAGLGASATVSGIIGIANSVGQIYEHSIIPNSASGNINGGDLNTANKTNTFYFITRSIKSEYAKIIDGFFNMYGYKVNTLKVPNITGRRNWNYVKTIGANIEGNIPQADIEELKSIFNNGVTLWHNTSTFLDYSQNNDII